MSAVVRSIRPPRSTEKFIFSLYQFISEVGRVIALAMTYRRCTKDWPLPGHDGVVIPKGMRVIVPVYPVHVSLSLMHFSMLQYIPHTVPTYSTLLCTPLISRWIRATTRILTSSTLNASARKGSPQSRLAPTCHSD